MNANILSILTTITLVLIFFTGVGYVLSDINTQNTQLDANSREALLDFNDSINSDLPANSIKTQSLDSNVTSGSGEEDFSREYRESRATVSDFKSNINTIKKIPSLYVKAAGIEQDQQIKDYLSIIGFILVAIIILAIYVAWKTGEVKNK